VLAAMHIYLQANQISDDPGRLPMLQLEEVHCVSEKRGKKRREKRKPSA